MLKNTGSSGGRRWLVAGAWCLIFLGGSAVGLQARETDERERRTKSPARWVGSSWEVQATHRHASTTTLVFEEVVATWRADRRWRLRADRLVALRSPLAPSTLDAMWAHGRVRIVGPAPLYVTGRQAFSWQPGARLEVIGARESEAIRPAAASGPTASIVGDGWRLSGQRVAIDLTVPSARIRSVGGPGGRTRADRHLAGSTTQSPGARPQTGRAKRPGPPFGLHQSLHRRE